MKDSTPDAMRKLLGAHGEAALEYVEASFLVRAVGFLFGWPGGAARSLLRPLYWAFGFCERLVEVTLPRHRWTYMMFVVRRPDPRVRLPVP